MRILLIDGQGGGIGSRLATLLRPRLPEDCELLCAGTNVLATNAMLKAGCTRGATGENAILYNAGRADLILGPIGVILANGIMGEVSPAAAAAVSGAQAGHAGGFDVACVGDAAKARAGEYNMDSIKELLAIAGK